MSTATLALPVPPGILERERADLIRALKLKQPGMRALISSQPSRLAETVVLAGSRQRGFERIVSCQLGDHAVRAQFAMKAYNAAAAAVKQ